MWNGRARSWAAAGVDNRGWRTIVVMRARLFVCALIVVGCGDSETKAAPIPEALRGAYGRSMDDLLHGTDGLTITADTLTLSEMTIAIKDGKLVGDDYQVNLAEVSWKKEVDKVPGKCKGTIARDGEHLFLRLFEQGSDAPCETILEGEWRAWKSTTEFPEGLRGWFGAAWTYSASEGFEIGPTALVHTAGGMFALERAMAWEGRGDEIMVQESSYGSAKCRGVLKLEEDQISSDLEPLDGTDEPCPRFYGERWLIDDKKLPKAPLTNGKVSITVANGIATVKSLAEPAMTCTQKVLRTKARATTDRGRDGIPVLGGLVLALEHAEPEGDMTGCSDAVKRLDATECQTKLGVFCDQEFLAALTDQERVVQAHCPTHIVIGDAELEGQRVALLPVRDPVNLVCFEMTERFGLKQ